MANWSKKKLHRSLDLLDRAVALSLRLGEQARKNTGRVGALRKRLQRARADLDAHRNSQPLDKRRSQQKADNVFLMLVEFLSEVIDESSDN